MYGIITYIWLIFYRKCRVYIPYMEIYGYSAFNIMDKFSIGVSGSLNRWNWVDICYRSLPIPPIEGARRYSIEILANTTFQEISNERTVPERTPKKPEYLMALATQLTKRGPLLIGSIYMYIRLIYHLYTTYSPCQLGYYMLPTDPTYFPGIQELLH